MGIGETLASRDGRHPEQRPERRHTGEILTRGGAAAVGSRTKGEDGGLESETL